MPRCPGGPLEREERKEREAGREKRERQKRERQKRERGRKEREAEKRESFPGGRDLLFYHQRGIELRDDVGGAGPYRGGYGGFVTAINQDDLALL